MATGEKILHKDVIEEGNPFEITHKGLLAYLADVEKGRKILQQNNLENGKSLKKQNKTMKDTIPTLGKLNDLKKKELALRKKLSDAATTEADVIAQLNVQNQQQNTINRRLAKVELSRAGSMAELSAKLALNKTRYMELSKAERENEAVGGKLLKTIQKQDREIKKLDKSIGNSQRNVGNYSSALDRLIPGFSGAISGARGFITTLKTLRGALIATGIGALVVALGTLVSWLKDSVIGAETFRRAMSAITTTIDVIKDRLFNLGSAFKALFNLDFKEFGRIVKESFTGIGKEIREEVAAADELTKRMNQLKREERELTPLIAKRRKEIEDLVFLSRDETVAYEERMEALKRASALEKQNLADLEDAAYRKWQILKEQTELNTSSETELQELADAEANYYNVVRETTAKRRELRNRETEMGNKWKADLKSNIAEVVEAERDRITSIDEMLDEENDLIGQELEMFVEAEEKKTATAKAEAEKRMKLEEMEARYKEGVMMATFDLAGALLEQNTAEFKILSTAQSIIATWTAATKVLKDVPYPASIAAMAQVIITGLANVAKINQVKFASGTDFVDDKNAPQGRDTIPAMVDRGEMILTRDDAAMVRGMGFGHSDIPGMLALNKVYKFENRQLAELTARSIAVQMEIRDGIHNIDNIWYDKDGNRVLKNKKRKDTYIN